MAIFKKNDIHETLKTPEQAKGRVFDHWSRLDDLCKRRFPNSENLAHEGLIYVLEQLEANDWHAFVPGAVRVSS